ncbi:MAG: response regulator [Spirochaetaceae bacterium]|jgi:DNA-binding response OmpR family regulator|nr:response regulator [Spirochaetaceae bacterium]
MINRKKILIADHDALNLDFFDLMLSKLGFAVEKAPDGQLVLDKIGGNEPPDMLIIDVVLPKVSGWEILRAAKADPKTMDIPVLLLSEINDVKEIVEAFELGAYDYIIKPFNFLVVLARIRAALRNKVLISQLGAREKRLILAEKLNADLKQSIASLQNETEELIREASDKFEKDGASFRARFEEKARLVKKMFSMIKENIEQTGAEWRRLKAEEIGMPILEKPINTVKL